MDDETTAAKALDLVREILAEHLGAADADRLVTELEGSRDALGERLTAGVNPPRTDYGSTWNDARAEAYRPTERAGAVHVELGTWRAFPSERVRELVDGDGLAEFIRLDSDPRFTAEVVADAAALPFRSGVIDRIGSNSTLEHIHNPRDVLSECHRVLRPGGVFVTTTPFVWHEHGYPNDYVRLTRGFYERVLTEVGFVDVELDRDTSSGLYYTLHNAAKMSPVDPERPEAAAMAELQRLIVTLLGTVIPLDRYFVDGAREWYHSVRVIARKPGPYEPSRRERSTGRPFATRALDLLADPLTKQPLVRNGRRLRCEVTGTEYPLTVQGGVNFLEPELPKRAVTELAAGAARRVRARLQR